MVSSLIYTRLIVREWLVILVYRFGRFRLRLRASAEFRLLFVWRWRHQQHGDGVNSRSEKKNPHWWADVWCNPPPPQTTWQESINSHHRRPPSSPLCLCICCSLRGRCSYEGEAAGRYSPPSSSSTFPPSPHMITFLSIQRQEYPPAPCIRQPRPNTATSPCKQPLCMSCIDPHLQTITTDNKRVRARRSLAAERTQRPLDCHTEAIEHINVRTGGVICLHVRVQHLFRKPWCASIWLVLLHC